ncbi:MAG: hypothetical protein HYR84_04600 [Planctomycetes bacterium]|nr:hypothetical protein [Planctomycetota bacterium]
MHHSSLRERRSYRPVVDELEDRTAPALLRFGPPLAPPPATHLHVIAPAHVETLKAFDVIVRAEDAKNHVVPTFKGTVQFTLGTADADATLPANYTFTAKDKGTHTFHMTLKSTVTQTVQAGSGALAGQDTVIVDWAATHFRVDAFKQAIAGTPTMVNVVALDANNNVVPGYTGKVHFSSTDIYAELPADYAFNAADAGSHLFSVTFLSSGKQSLGVREVGGSPAGMAQTKVVWPWAPYNPMPMNYPPYSPWYTAFPGYSPWMNPWF